MPGHATVRPAYLAVGANRQTAAADWSDNGTLCFGAGTNLAVWRPAAARGIQGLVSGHSDTIKAVRFLPGPVRRCSHRRGTACRYLVTGGDDHALRVWRVCGGDDSDNGDTEPQGTAAAVCVCTVEAAHAAPINCIAAPALPRHGDSNDDNDDNDDNGSKDSTVPQLFATGGADAAVKIWALVAVRGATDDDTTVSVVPVQTIRTNPRFFPLCLALVPLDEAAPSANLSWLLAAAGTSNRIQIFVGSRSVGEDETRVSFSLQTSLAGHEGWVRSLDFARERGSSSSSSGNDLLLASASQDKYVRLWRIRRGPFSGGQAPSLSSSSSAAPASSLPLPSPSNKAHLLRCGRDGDDAATYAIAFEALLLGHEDWIYSARWDNSSNSTRSPAVPGRLRLLTASADNSLAIWEADAASGIWVTTARLGELSKEKGATTATGSVGGFWTGLWAPDGASVATLCRTGSWRRWTAVAAATHDDGGGGGGDDALRWVQAVGISGHVAPVTGVAWSREGSYLLSTGSDQTTRLHAEWCRQDHQQQQQQQQHTARDSWHEMARPQIHGYDINCIDSLGPQQFVSGADEKLMRVFHEPKTVARLLARLTRSGRGTSTTGSLCVDALPDAADMPVLGLSNKSVDVEGVDEAAPAQEAAQGEHGPDSLDSSNGPRDPNEPNSDDHPPFEDTLSRGTLWPETEKLYGHGYEISCLAASHDGRLIASACRASSLRHAVVRLFETAPRWTEVRPPLAAHALTVTRLRFSPDDRFLLSVGRDRQWAVFEAATAEDGSSNGPGQDDPASGGGSGSNTLSFRLRQANPKAHTRMLLDCAWAPTPAAGAAVFATAGRDKTVKVWRMAPAEASAPAPAGTAAPTGDAFVLATTLPQDHPPTAIDFLARPSTCGGLAPFFVLAVGTEGGKLSVVSLDTATLAATTFLALDQGFCLPKAVLQLAWRPPAEDEGQEGNETPQTDSDLAIAGEDGSLRVYRVTGV